MDKRLLIFDLDGTLIDTIEDYTDKGATIITDFYGIQVAKACRLYLKTSCLPFVTQLELLFPGKTNNIEVIQIFEN